jgi:hypothetical protein
LPKSSVASLNKLTPPGTKIPGKWQQPAKAIIIAGKPLSQVATPTTPFAVGNDRINRRKTIAASLRKGNESIIPLVP